MQSTNNNGNNGHWFRRSVHLMMAIIPFLYYWYSLPIARLFHLQSDQLVSIIIIVIIMLELLRLSQGWVIYGQRDYEAKQISAFAWSGFSIGLVLLAAPKIGIQFAAIGSPLIWSMCIADPIMGECRRKNIGKRNTIFIGLLAVAIIWLLGFFFLQTPWLFVPFVVPVTILAEWIKTPAIDDNALMLFLPLAVIFILLPWA